MKKILLSSIACLLALGLVTACDNEEEDVSTGGDSDTTQESGGTTTEGGETTATTLSNYTLSFTFTYGGETEAVPEYASAYLIGGWDNWGDFLPLTEKDGVYSYTFSSIKVASYEYLVILDYNDVDEPGWNHKTTSANQSLTVDASQGDDHIENITIACDMSLTDLIVDPSIAPRTNYTVVFQFLDENGDSRTLDGENVTLYIGGGWDNWSEYVACTLDSTNSVYYYKFDEISVGTYGFLGTTDKTFATDDCKVITGVGGSDASITISADEESDGAVQLIYVDSNGVVISEDSEEEIEDVGTRFYIVFLDSSATATADGLTGHYINSSDESSVFMHNGDATYHNYTSATAGTTDSGVAYLYTTTYGTLEAESEEYFYIWVESGLNISTGTITIPETADDTFAVYVCNVDLTSTEHQEDTSKGAWETGVTDLSAFLAALTVEDPTDGGDA